MPNIFDNIEKDLLNGLTDALETAERADFCVGYFNLRGWTHVARHIDKLEGGDAKCCRLLIGINQTPGEELRKYLDTSIQDDVVMDNQRAQEHRRKIAEDFRNQLIHGLPSNADEKSLRSLAKQIRANKLVIKLFCRYSLHAKLYLFFRDDKMLSQIGYLGSSNLTLAGIKNQGELNIDVTDNDATSKLAQWFEDRWNDQYCIDISDELVQIIDESWAREDIIPPYNIYIKIAYHLSEDVREGARDFKIPHEFKDKLWDFQEAAVKQAAAYLNKRNGVMIGDVVGLGKTIMASALAKIFINDQRLDLLILSPANLVSMWEDYNETYRLHARVVSFGKVTNQLEELRRYQLVIIDESHNLRNRKKSRRYRAIHDYLKKNDCKCILLSATPYNKAYTDLSAQLRLFLDEKDDLGVRPERYLRENDDRTFLHRHNDASVRSLVAFEQSEHPDDWRDLMYRYLVRRTRRYIRETYASEDEAGRKYLPLSDGQRSYFPVRTPRTVRFKVDASDSEDQYARLFSDKVINAIGDLKLPRYGLRNYLREDVSEGASASEREIIDDLTRAGKRLMGFCRTNLLKRLESSGHAFLLSLQRHILRNYVYVHALKEGLELPIGQTDVGSLDSIMTDEEDDLYAHSDTESVVEEESLSFLESIEQFEAAAGGLYGGYVKDKSRFRWIGTQYFRDELLQDLRSDAELLVDIWKHLGNWDANRDNKLRELEVLLTKQHSDEKVLIFSEYADTVYYLKEELARRGLTHIEAVTGSVNKPTEFAWRFSPQSAGKASFADKHGELRVVIATDVLSEGQNLQDGHIVVNYDLPWAIIRLIQRAGRVDRIGQRAEEILCYSFFPADGIEQHLGLRERVIARLHENGSVIGMDEVFFEGDKEDAHILSEIFNERNGALDGDDLDDSDLPSQAYKIWKDAIDNDKSLEKAIVEMPDVVYSSKAYEPSARGLGAQGVLVYVRNSADNDTLAWVNREGVSITESQAEILQAAACEPDTPAKGRHEEHHKLVGLGLKHVARETRSTSGALGRATHPRRKTYDRLSAYLEGLKKENSVFSENKVLRNAIAAIYEYPLQDAARESLARQFNVGIEDYDLAHSICDLHENGKLCNIRETPTANVPRIICSLGLWEET